MRYTKEVEYNESRARFVSRLGAKSIVYFLMCAALSAGAVALISVLTFRGGADVEPYRLAIFCVLTAIFGALFVLFVVYTAFRCKHRYDAAIDDEHVILRYGSGYIKFNRYELGAIKTKLGTAVGHGDKDFDISRGGVRFMFGGKKRFLRIKDADKLGYVLSNMAQFPDSGVDWGVAYDSK